MSFGMHRKKITLFTSDQPTDLISTILSGKMEKEIAASAALLVYFYTSIHLCRYTKIHLCIFTYHYLALDIKI